MIVLWMKNHSFYLVWTKSTNSKTMIVIPYTNTRLGESLCGWGCHSSLLPFPLQTSVSELESENQLGQSIRAIVLCLCLIIIFLLQFTWTSFFNVNVIRKYKQGSNLTQNHPKENKNKETSTTQKTRGASSYGKEEWWRPDDNRCVGPAMIFILFDKRCFLKKKKLCVEVNTNSCIMNRRPNSALVQICFIYPV